MLCSGYGRHLEKWSKTKLQKLREHSLHFTCSLPVPDHKLLKLQQVPPISHGNSFSLSQILSNSDWIMWIFSVYANCSGLLKINFMSYNICFIWLRNRCQSQIDVDVHKIAQCHISVGQSKNLVGVNRSSCAWSLVNRT